MGAVFDFLFSPAGLAAYAAFWAFKLLAGAWIIGRALMLLPVRVRRKTQVRLGRMRRRSAQ